ncbi:hypothetical protein JAO73_21585 [Hymenobacter sp. BT523]|nr:hypothetical protein [Hymenobacter sp. BT523]MBJ6111629.1 hypothetical protein [Hymenobacter sp. BT523]
MRCSLHLPGASAKGPFLPVMITPSLMFSVLLLAVLALTSAYYHGRS